MLSMQERLLARGAGKVVETPQLFAHNHRLLLPSTKAQCRIGLYTPIPQRGLEVCTDFIKSL